MKIKHVARKDIHRKKLSFILAKFFSESIHKTTVEVAADSKFLRLVHIPVISVSNRHVGLPNDIHLDWLRRQKKPCHQISFFFFSGYKTNNKSFPC